MDTPCWRPKGDFSSLPDISLAEDDTLTIGRKVYVAGYPYGMPFTITEGSVSSPKQLMDGKYIQTDAAVNPGNSGGPILDEDNRVVGVTVSKFTQADNMGFGIRSRRCTHCWIRSATSTARYSRCSAAAARS